MKLFMQIVKTQAVALLALIAAAGLVAAYGAYESSIQPSVVDPAGSARIGFLGTLLIGFLPVAAFGAPAYVWLARHSRANWASVSVLALAPAAILALIDLELGLLGAVCGLVIAGATHAVCRRWVSPNNSFKPNPLRGSA